MKIVNLLAAASLVAFPTISFVSESAFALTAEAASAAKLDAPELKMGMRKLWEEHIIFTRNYIISELASLPDTTAVADRLLQNQADLGNAIKPFYGAAAGDKLTALLREHIVIATDVVKAAKAGNRDRLQSSQRKWSVNGHDIAMFLASANPNWSRAELEIMLQKHLDLTTAEVQGRLSKDWVSDIHNYDLGHEHMLMFSDILVAGIVKQFPEKFK